MSGAVIQVGNDGVCAVVVIVEEIGRGHVQNIFWRWSHQDLPLGCGL